MITSLVVMIFFSLLSAVNRLMRGSVTMVIVRIIEPIAGAKKQTGHGEKSGEDYQNEFDIHNL